MFKLLLADFRLGAPLCAIITFFGCLVIAVTLHEPIPRVHDEFSYVLMGETFSKGHIATPTPPLPEFFETFHVLLQPVYASKYFPAQGIFLAVGQKLTGHPAVGIWLSSALACAAMTWMLQAWVTPAWGLLGGFLMLLQYGVFSYWSQTYWGGMVAVLGGALFFGALRRLWEHFSWQNGLWLSFGLVILANSRPLESALAVLPATVLLLHHLWHNRRWREAGFCLKFLLPCFIVLVSGGFAMGAYNRAITGSVFKTPYVLHEEQYQESPPFIFLPMRPAINYSSPMLSAYYHVRENGSYNMQRKPSKFVGAVARKLITWWAFYCGILLTGPLVIPGMLRGGRIRFFQIALVVAFIMLSFSWSPITVLLSTVIDFLALAQIVLLWYIFDDRWSRLAIATCALLLIELFFTKWSFPHYFAPAACLVLYLEIEGLRRIWNWSPHVVQTDRALTRSERRRITRDTETRRKQTFNLRGLVYLLPVACAISLVLRVEGRLNGWKDDPHGPDRQALLMSDWSLRRADLDHWMEQQPTPQLVFVRYAQNHNVNFEWVYNHPDIMHSHVIWARDLGATHNKLLLQLVQDRTVWLLEADRRNPQLIPYDQATGPSMPQNPARIGSTEQEQLE